MEEGGGGFEGRVDEGLESGTYAHAYVDERVRVDTRRRGHVDVLPGVERGDDGFVVARLVQPSGMGTPVTAYVLRGIPGEHPVGDFMLAAPFTEEPGVVLRDGDGAAWFAPVEGDPVRLESEPGTRAYGAFSALGFSTLDSFHRAARFGRFRIVEREGGSAVLDAILSCRAATVDEATTAEDAVARASRSVEP